MTSDPFVERLVRFGRTLREHGVEVGPGRIQDAIVALTAVDVTVRDDVYWALCCTLCSRREHIAVFEPLFDALWRGQSGTAEPRPLLSVRPNDDDSAEEGVGQGTKLNVALESAIDPATPRGESDHGKGASASERLLALDFREYGQQELHDARRLIERVAVRLPRRRSFRLEPATAGRHLDVRRTLRDSMHTEGYAFQRAWRRNRLVPRRTLFLLDISGSMSPYARAMVMFAQAAVQAGRSVEAFTFGTRLTRLTAHLAGPDPDRALGAAAKAVPDWSGGTRIGESIKAFNDSWGRQGLSRGAAVIVVSDGWERGDTRLLNSEMARLHRAAYAVIWVNPLAADPRYQPLAAGMAAALPFVDVFLPGHNLSDLVSLVTVLERLPNQRGRSGLHLGAAA